MNRFCGKKVMSTSSLVKSITLFGHEERIERESLIVISSLWVKCLCEALFIGAVLNMPVTLLRWGDIC
jgi:hypothetical protein